MVDITTIRPPAKSSPAMGQRLFGYPYSTTGSNFTFATLLTVEADYDFVQLIYENHTASPYTVSAASVAPTAKPNDGYNPVDGSNAAITATTVTFNNAGADSLPIGTTGGTATISVPAGSGSPPNAIPAKIYSDWMPIQSLARSDGGTLPLLMIRSYFASGAPSAFVATPTSDLITSWPTIDDDRLIQTYYKSGDCVTTPANFTSPTGPSQYITPHAVRFYSRKRGLTVLTGGDSLTQGYLSTSSQNGFGFQAVKALSTTSYPISLINVGYAGQTSIAFYSNIKNGIDTYSPDVVTIPIWTPNDAATAAAANAAWQQAMTLCAYAVSKGAVPVFITAIPWNSLNTTQDAYRILNNNRARNSGYLYADFDAVISDGATPARIIPAYGYGDGVHLNDAGYGAEATVFEAVLARIKSASRLL